MPPSLTFLGTGTAIPSADRGPTAALLRTPYANVLLDAGSGTLQKLAREGVDLFSLDALFLTHTHLDHLADLLPLAFALAIPRLTRERPLQVFLSPTALSQWERLQDAMGHWLAPPPENMTLVAVEPGSSLDTLGLQVTTAPVDHHESSIGWRFTLPSGASLAWPGDTGPCTTLAPLVANATLAVLECGFPDGVPLPGHLHPAAILDAISGHPPESIAIVHRYPLALADESLEDQLRRNAPCSVVFPSDGSTLPLHPR